MENVAWIMGLLTAVTLLAVLARRFAIPYPTLMVLAGAAIGLAPGLPKITLDPGFVLVVFLPPLLYAAAWGLPWNEFRANLRPIMLLAVGLTLATTVAVACVAQAVVPGLPWAAAFVLGALVSPPDAIAATSVMKFVQVPRRIVVILEGESLVNDAMGLVAYRLAVAAVVTGFFSWSEAAAHLIWVVTGGCVIGLLAARIAAWVHRRLDDAIIETAITLLTPFAAYIPAELLETSGVLATVAAGISMRRQAPLLFSSALRLHSQAVWELVVFLLNGLAFVLIGLELPSIVGGIQDESPTQIALWALLVLGTTILVRMLWIFPAAYLPRMVSRELRERDPAPPWQALVVIGWTGMRGVVSLAAALALPETTLGNEPFPFRNLIVFLTFCVILGTLLSQSLTLPALIRALKLTTPRSLEQEETDARLDILSAAIRFLEINGDESQDCLSEIEHVRRHFEIQASHAMARIAEVHPEYHAPIVARQELHRGALSAQRQRLDSLRETSQYDVEVIKLLERELDLAETQMQSTDYRPGVPREYDR